MTRVSTFVTTIIDCLHHQNELCKCELMNIKVHHKCPIITCTVIIMHCQQLSLCICLQQKSSLFLPSSQQSSRAASLDFSLLTVLNNQAEQPHLIPVGHFCSNQGEQPHLSSVGLFNLQQPSRAASLGAIIRAVISHISGSPRSLQQSADPERSSKQSIELQQPAERSYWSTLSNTHGSPKEAEGA